MDALGLDPFFIIEVAIVGIIVLSQIFVFLRNNNAIRQLAEIYPNPARLNVEENVVEEVEGTEIATTAAIPYIGGRGPFHPAFSEILAHTNGYLRKNPNAADFDVLKEMAEDKVDSKENAIESNIALPLYIGLLCTFIGVIIGLIRISTTGVTDAAIQSFIGGVLIGMVGSATGLALTVRSNYVFKEAKKVRDAEQYNYFAFLRSHILPARAEVSATPLSTLRDNLTAFNDGFARYQQHVNESLRETLRLFQDLSRVFEHLRTIELGLGGVGQFLQTNDKLIDKQVAYLNSYAQQAEAFVQKLNGHFSTVDRHLGTLVDENIKTLDNSAQAAYMKMDRYLASLTQGEAKTFADSLNNNITQIRNKIATLEERNIALNEQLLKQVEAEHSGQQEMARELKAIRNRMDQPGEGAAFLSTGGFRFFVYAGTAAFIIGIVAGVMYLINQFAA